jgi:carbonic anhydrase
MELTEASIFFFISLCVGFCSAADWSYNNVKDWNRVYLKDCGGQNQSPIDIQTAKLTPSNSLGTFSFSEAYEQSSNSSTYEMINNGHTVQLNIKPNPALDLSISGGGLSSNATYKFAQFHMHWGAEDCNGSEHTLDGLRFPMELHLVHYNSIYNNLTEAAVSGKQDALAVLGVS